MDAASSEVSRFNGVVLAQLVLYAERPLDRVGRNLVGDVAGRRRPSVRLAQIAAKRDFAGSDSSLCEERRRKHGRKIFGIDSCAELRRVSRASDIVKDDVVGPSDSGADRSGCLLAAPARDAEPRSKAFVAEPGLSDTDHGSSARNRLAARLL